MATTKRKKYMPGIEGGRFHHHNPDGPDVDIGPEGIVTDDPKKIELLDNSKLKGNRVGFYEVPVEPARQPQDDKDEVNSFEDVPGDAEFPYNYGGAYYFLSNGEKVQGKQNAEDAQATLNEEPDPADEELATITTINEAKDYLTDVEDIDEESLSSKKSILEAATSVGIKFPMLK